MTEMFDQGRIKMNCRNHNYSPDGLQNKMQYFNNSNRSNQPFQTQKHI